MDARCTTCLWWEREPGRASRRGKCRRHAPTAAPDAMHVTAHWPVTDEADWCGEHKDSNGRFEHVGLDVGLDD